MSIIGTLSVSLVVLAMSGMPEPNWNGLTCAEVKQMHAMYTPEERAAIKRKLTPMQLAAIRRCLWGRL